MTSPTPWSDEAAAVEAVVAAIAAGEWSRIDGWESTARSVLTALEPYIPGAEKLLGGDGHQVVIEFDGGMPGLTLLHPDGGCTAPMQCGLCAADLSDPDAKRCYDCRDMAAEGCWLQGWFDNLDYGELLHGTVTLPIDAEWDGDHPKITVSQPPQHPTSGLDGGVERDGVYDFSELEALQRAASNIVAFETIEDKLGLDDWAMLLLDLREQGFEITRIPASAPSGGEQRRVEEEAIEDRATVVLSLREANTAVTPLQVMVHEGKAVAGSPVAQVAEVLAQRIANAYRSGESQSERSALEELVEMFAEQGRQLRERGEKFGFDSHIDRAEVWEKAAKCASAKVGQEGG